MLSYQGAALAAGKNRFERSLPSERGAREREGATCSPPANAPRSSLRLASSAKG